MGFQVTEPTSLVLMLSIHPSRISDLRTPHLLVFEPVTRARDYTDTFGNNCTRIVAQPGIIRISTSFTVVDSGEPDRQSPNAHAMPVEELPDDALMFLLGSRYCETDKLSATAWRLFGGITPGWDMIQDICDFAHRHIKFDYQQADSTRSAADVYDHKVGVCRDYAHLAVTLCRCMNIPARYCTGYMGDIGVPLVPPMDFSAWFDVYLDGGWHTFDARNNRPRIGRILMARGRDATDVALTTSFGRAPLHVFEVHSEPVDSTTTPEVEHRVSESSDQRLRDVPQL